MTRQVTVLAGGWSASQFDLRKLPGTVIAVNDAAIFAPRIDYIVSMDRLWAEHRFEQISKFGKPLWLRKATLKNAMFYRDLKLPGHVTAFDNDHQSTTLSDDPIRLNGTHSGFCALNLAYHLAPLELYLVGLDLKRGPRGESHWYPPYAWSPTSSGTHRLAEWSAQFDTAARQLREKGVSVFIAGPTAVKSFVPIDRCTLEERAKCAA